MEINSIRFYEGNNIKRHKKVVKISIENASDKETAVYLKNYFRICFLLGFKERLIDIDKGKVTFLWVTYSQEELARYILMNVFNNVLDLEKIVEKASTLVSKGLVNYIVNRADEFNIPCIKLSDEIFQLGYGKNSLVVEKERKEVFDADKIPQEIEAKTGDYFLKCLSENGIGLIPIVSITGTNGKTTTARLVHHMLNKLGINTGLTSTGGVFIGNEKIRSGDTTGFLSARDVLTNESVEAAVFETARGGILKNGLGYEKARAAIVTSISEDHIGMQGIKDIKDLLDVKSVVLEELDDNGKMIIKAEEELVRIALRELDCCFGGAYCRRKKIRANKKKEVCIFNIDKNECMEEYIETGGEALFLDDDYIIHCKSGVERRILNVKAIPFTHNGLSKGNMLNLMAAIAATSTIVNDIEKIIETIKDLKCDLYSNPGRQNVVDIGDFKVILDYGHNAEAYEEVFNLAKSLKPSRITSIIAAAGDRMDKYIKELGTIAAKHSDYIIVREQEDLRGRKKDESATLIKTGVLETGFREEFITTIYKEQEALAYAMDKVQIGEVIVLFTQCLDVIMPVINDYLKGIGKVSTYEDIDFSH